MSDPEDASENIGDMMGLVRRLAMLVLSSPAEEREQQYEMAREVGRQAGVQGGLSDDEAEEAGANLERWTRALVNGVLDGEPPG